MQSSTAAEGEAERAIAASSDKEKQDQMCVFTAGLGVKPVMLVQVDTLLYQLNSDSEGDEGSDIDPEAEEDGDEEANQGSGAESSGEGGDNSASEAQHQTAAEPVELLDEPALCRSTDKAAAQGLAAAPGEADMDVSASKPDQDYSSTVYSKTASAQKVAPETAQHAHSDAAPLPADVESSTSRAGHVADAAAPSHSQLQQGLAASSQGVTASAQELPASSQALGASSGDGNVTMVPSDAAGVAVAVLPRSADAGPPAPQPGAKQPVPAALPVQPSRPGQKRDTQKAAGAFACVHPAVVNPVVVADLQEDMHSVRFA